MTPGGDDALAAKVKEALRNDGHVSSAEFVVTVKHGHVTLEGTVPTYGEKLAAVEAVAQVEDVKGVEDEVAVEPPSRLGDAEIARLIAAALAEHPDIPARNITVSVKKGRATLAGNVPAVHVWTDAEEAALDCEGVCGVRNLLVVDPVAVREDGEVAEEIVGVLERERHLDAAGVEVRCVDGRVTLSGWVGSLPEKLRAERATARVRGVVALTNAIRVR